MLAVRRFLVLVALMFWLGGFTFYAGVVVPVGTDVLGSALAQGYITREVARQLNLTALFALAPLAWDALATRDSSRLRWRARIGTVLVMALCQALLFVLHAHLDHLMRDAEDGINEEVFQAAFRPAHRAYLWIHTVQWFAGVVYIWLMLRGWTAEDHLQ